MTATWNIGVRAQENICPAKENPVVNALFSAIYSYSSDALLLRDLHASIHHPRAIRMVYFILTKICLTLPPK